jgi:Holliday junction DNA helicase RuvA
MISYLHGKIIYKDDKKVVVDILGMGFDVFLSFPDIKEIKEGDEKIIFTHLFLKEKEVELYGFLTLEKLNLFKVLKEISGVGPKSAMSLSSAGSLKKLKKLIEEGILPEGVNGIGKKRLQTILLEITGKVKEVSNNNQKDDTLEALVVLGFNKEEAKNVIKQLPKELKGTEEKVKEALKFLRK